jgi:maltose 6'-phosphate phosphatase
MRSILPIMILSIAMLSGCASKSPEKESGSKPVAQCEDVVNRKYLNILSINLLFSEIETREQRLDAIAEFAAK